MEWDQCWANFDALVNLREEFIALAHSHDTARRFIVFYGCILFCIPLQVLNLKHFQTLQTSPGSWTFWSAWLPVSPTYIFECNVSFMYPYLCTLIINFVHPLSPFSG